MASAHKDLQLVQTEPRETQRVNLDGNGLLTIVTKFDVHREVGQMQGLVDVGKELGEGFLVAVEKSLVGEVQTVGGVGFVHEFVVEDVQYHRFLIFIVIGIHRIFFAVNVLLNQETAFADHKLRKVVAGLL